MRYFYLIAGLCGDEDGLLHLRYTLIVLSCVLASNRKMITMSGQQDRLMDPLLKLEYIFM